MRWYIYTDLHLYAWLCIYIYMHVCTWPKAHTQQCTASHCDTVQHTASTVQHTAAHGNTLHTWQHTATHCDTLQHSAAHGSTRQHTAAHSNTLQLQHTAGATHCNCNTLQLQHTANATHCSVNTQNTGVSVRLWARRRIPMHTHTYHTKHIHAPKHTYSPHTHPHTLYILMLTAKNSCSGSRARQ